MVYGHLVQVFKIFYCLNRMKVPSDVCGRTNNCLDIIEVLGIISNCNSCRACCSIYDIEVLDT